MKYFLYTVFTIHCTVCPYGNEAFSDAQYIYVYKEKVLETKVDFTAVVYCSILIASRVDTENGIHMYEAYQRACD